MKKIKVLQMPVANTGGGITQYAMQNFRFIDKQRFQFDFVTFSDKLNIEQEINLYGGKVHYLTTRAEDNKEKFIEDMNRILDENYDVVHLHTSFWKDFLVEELAIKRNISKVIVHAHSTMIDINNHEAREKAIQVHEQQKQLFNIDLATHFCACSNAAADWLFGPQIPREKIIILKNAIDTEKFSYKEEVREEYRKRLNIENCFVLGHVGRFMHSKNHQFIIDIFIKVFEVLPNTRLVLVGDGPLLDDIKNSAKDNQIKDKVLFLGRRTDVENIMQAMDIFLLPSEFEGLGLVLIEAQCGGLKCFSSEYVPGEAKVTDLLEYLPNDATEWAEEIIKYHSKQIKRECASEQIGDVGYCLKRQIKEIEHLYSEGL